MRRARVGTCWKIDHRRWSEKMSILREYKKIYINVNTCQEQCMAWARCTVLYSSSNDLWWSFHVYNYKIKEKTSSNNRCLIRPGPMSFRSSYCHSWFSLKVAWITLNMLVTAFSVTILVEVKADWEFCAGPWVPVAAPWGALNHEKSLPEMLSRLSVSFGNGGLL